MFPSLAAWVILGLALGSYVRYLPLFLHVSLFLIALGLTWAERRQRMSTAAGIAAYAALLCGFLYWPLYETFLTGMSVPLTPSTSTTLVTGRVVTPVRMAPDRLSFVVEPYESGSTVTPTPGNRIRVTWRVPERTVRHGDVVAFETRLHPPSGTQNPGDFDFAAYLQAHGIQAVATVSGPEAMEVLEPGEQSWRWMIWTRLDEWRQHIVRVAVTSLSDPTLGMFLGIVVGEQGWVSPELREDFVATGTVHILSISGSHLGLIAGLVFGAGHLACRWLPVRLLLFLTRHRLSPTRLAALATAPLVGGYALLAGAEVATIRALIMILLFLMAVWLGREKFLLPVLSAAALGTLLADPRTLYDVSFQLSYGSVWAIAALVHLQARREQGLEEATAPRWILALRWLAGALFLSLAVTAVTLPLVAKYFHQLAWISPFANVLLLPFAAILVPLGLGSACWLLVTDAPTLPLASWLESGCELLRFVMSGLAHLPAINWHVAAPSIILMAVYYGVLAMLLRPQTDAPWRVAAAACLVGLVLWWAWPHRTLPSDTVRVTMLDVGQGDATLIEVPGGGTVLIDAGAKRERLDLGASVVGPLLWDRGIRRLDHAIGTHPQLDHIGGLPWVLRHFPIDRYWGNGMTRQEPFYRDLQAALAEQHLSETQPLDGASLSDGTRCQVTVEGRSPIRMTKTADTRTSAAGSVLNNASLVSRLDCGFHSFLFAADVEAVTLRDWMVENRARPVTILKVPHHGARSSLHRPWIHALHPQLALVSAGRQNPYHHPHPEVLSAYAAEGVPVLRTDRDGAVTLMAALDEPTISITTARQLQLEPVAIPGDAWEGEWRNYHRLCQRQFDRPCRLLRSPR